MPKMRKQDRQITLAGDLSSAEDARIAAIRVAVGSMAHVSVSVEDLHLERQDDKRKEEAVQEPCVETHG